MKRHVLLIALALACSSASAEATKPKGWSDRSYYLPMQDGTRVALSLYFPDGKEPTKPAPVIFFQTRYGRALAFYESAPWLKAGYVVASADMRGSTSSFGPRNAELSPEEVRDMDVLIQHLATQPWSNGQIIANGGSYLADTADWATSRPVPALLGSIPRETDFDIYLHLIAPGGIVQKSHMRAWGKFTEALDHGRQARLGPFKLGADGADCRLRVADCLKQFPALQPVDGDESYTLLRKALNGRKRWSYEGYANAEFRDDKGGNTQSLFAMSPASAIADIRREKKPVNYWGSWFDAGMAEAAIARFRSAPEVPAEIWITPHDHTGQFQSDPFFPQVKEPNPSEEKQVEIMQGFADRLRSGAKIERKIHYYVLGTGQYRETEAWPPKDAVPTRLVFAPGRKLVESSAPVAEGVDRYRVDFTATTGTASRWTTQMHTPAAYGDRRAADRKLLTYDAAPAADDAELVGTPVVTLQMSAATKDPALFVYLEDVAPDGRVTYLTEGLFRAIHRKPADPATLPYDQGPAPHSFNRADALPVVPGAMMEVKFALYPVASLVRRGHHLRVAVAGADADEFPRHSDGKPDVFTVRYGGATPSTIEVTTRPWR